MSKGMEAIHIVYTILRCVKAASQQITLEREELFTVSTGHRKLRSRTYYISYCCSMFEYEVESDSYHENGTPTRVRGYNWRYKKTKCSRRCWIPEFTV